MAAPKTFAELLYQSFAAINGPFIAIAGLALTFVSYYYVPSTASVPMRIAIPVLTIGAFSVFLLVHAAYSAHIRDRNYLPDVRFASPAPRQYEPAVALLLLSPSPIFSYDMVLSVYRREDEMENLVGLGRVINIQEDGKIQILVTHDLGYGEEWSAFRNNDAKLLKQLLVKPNVPSYAMEIVTNAG